MPHIRTRDGKALHYRDIGRGPACVMLHGFGMDPDLWLPVVLPRARQNRFVILSLRGFGGSRSVPLSQPNILAQNADDLHDLVEELGLKGASLCGLSLGAATGLQYQRAYGLETFRAYAHVDQSPCIKNDAEWRWGLMGEGQDIEFARGREVLKAFAGIDRARPFKALTAEQRAMFWSFLADFFEAVVRRPSLRRAAALVRTGVFGHLIVDANNWGTYLDCVRSYLEEDYDYREALRGVSVPLSVFVGMDSAPYPAEGQLRIASYARHTELIRFEDCGHAIPIEAPVRFARQFARFLDGRP